MAELNFTSYKYNHDRAQPMSREKMIMLVVIAVLVPLAFILFLPVGFAMLVLWIVLFVKSRKGMLCIAPRFMTCGPTILYYRNITRMTLQKGGQKEPAQLTLFCGAESLKIMQDRFPTGARKPDKIKANTEAKFNKVSGRIIAKVLKVTPDVALSGIDRATILADMAAAKEGNKS